MSVAAKVRQQLAKRAPRLEEAAVRANWRRHNRARAFDPGSIADATQQRLVDALTRDGVVVSSFDELIADPGLWDEASEKARRLHADWKPEDAETGSKGTFLTKLASREFDAADPFVRIALHPAVLNVANGYLQLRSTLRALELWHTRPTPGSAIQTQLWHRDADDVMNVKLFVYFTDVRVPAGPLTYAPGTHPLGSNRTVPEHDEHRRSTDGQMARIVPESEWRILEGPPGTIVFADTCGYHKQLKPESDERVKLVAHYVSGTPYVASALALDDVDERALSEDQYYAVFDRGRA
jgi:Phytanoyl-CoA dioxygenase (PhyH)